MTKRTIRRFRDAEHVSLAAAEEFVRLAHWAIAARGRFAVALSGGSTPRRLFQILAGPPFRGQVNWPKVEFFWGDERSVPPDHKDSNYRMASEAMLKSLGIAEAKIHRIQAERSDREAAAKDYQAEIARVFGVSPDGPPPAFDLVLLGMGPDGHTASLFPHTTALKETTRWVVPNFVQKFDTYRLTMTYPILDKAAQVLFLVAGDDKTAVLKEVLEGPPDAERLPSQAIRTSPGKLVWYLDDAAARQLKNDRNAVKMAPSILAADFARLGDQVREAEKAGADRIHVDVMDGHFVPNISIGPLIVEALRPVTDLTLEAHLMIEEPDRYLEAFAEAGVDGILVHQEGAVNLHRTIQHIRKLGKYPGVVINPATPASVLEEILPDVDLVLVMTVNPGFGGQQFINSTRGKIRKVRQMIDAINADCELEVDGGIDHATAPLAVEAGARVLVAGSAIFRAKGGIAAAMAAMPKEGK